MLAFPLFYHRQLVGSLTFDLLSSTSHFAVSKHRQRLTSPLHLLTYELVQEDERGDVTGQAQELAHDHEPVPRLNGQSHHQQLRQDQRGEGNGHDVHELGLEEQQRSVHDDAS